MSPASKTARAKGKATKKEESGLAMESERFLMRSMLESVGIALCSFDRIGRKFHYISESLHDITGYPADRIRGEADWKELIHPDDLHRHDLIADRVREGRTGEGEYRIRHADGGIRWVSAKLVAVGDRIDGVLLDITSRKNAELATECGQQRSTALSRSVAKHRLMNENVREERFRRLMELSPQPMLTHREGEILYINRMGLQALGFRDESELIGQSLFDIVHPEMLPFAIERLKQSKNEKGARMLEYRLIRADGQIIHAEVTGIYDEQTQTHTMVFQDVTERIRMQSALQASEERYRQMVELSPLPIAIYKDGAVTFVNASTVQVLGAESPERILGMSPLHFVHPEDQEFAVRRMAETLRNGCCSLAEYRLIGFHGKAIHVSISSILDPRTGSVMLVFSDVTARKQVEKALSESEEMNRRLVELSPQAIILHSNYRIEYANPAAKDLLGTTDDIAGHFLPDRIHPDDWPGAIVRFDRVYDDLTAGPMVEQKLVRYDGTFLSVEEIMAPIPYKGKNAGISLLRDITERKKAEERRRIAEYRLVESKDMYFRLQTSLDRFSSDLFGVVEVSELERRLLQEVTGVLQVGQAGILEVDREEVATVRRGECSPDRLPERLYQWSKSHLPLCEIVDIPDGHLLRLGEFRGKHYLLHIGEKSSFLRLPPKRIWLETICRYVSVLYDNFRVIEDLTRELEQTTQTESTAPSWLLRLLFKLSEHERKRLSQDLHDAALQEQIIWYRKLEQLQSDAALPADIRSQLEPITQGLLDVIYQIRITCVDLRPPMLKQEGLVSSLESLFEFTQLRSDYSIRFEAADFRVVLTEDQMVGLYRIVQELLANATKHSNATSVRFSLTNPPNWIHLAYEDNGVGMDVGKAEDAFVSMGVYGMKERVRSMNGKIAFRSSPNKGLSIHIRIPLGLEGRK